MSAASVAPESRRLEEWEVELAEVRAMTEREMENLITEDDTPVDNILSEKQQRLLTEPLYSAWAGPEMRAPEHRGFWPWPTSVCSTPCASRRWFPT